MEQDLRISAVSAILRSFPRKRESRAKIWVPAFALGHAHISSVEDTEVARNPSYWLITRSVWARGAGFAKSLFRLPNWKACACPSAFAGTSGNEPFRPSARSDAKTVPTFADRALSGA